MRMILINKYDCLSLLLLFLLFIHLAIVLLILSLTTFANTRLDNRYEEKFNYLCN